MNRAVLKKAAFWLALILLLSALGEHAAILIFPAIVVALMVFPGPDPRRPRLVRAAPWYWGLNWAAAVVLGVARLFGRELVQGEFAPENWELVSVLLTAPALVFSLIRREPWFRWALVGSTALSLAGLAYDYFDGPGGGGELLQWVVFSVLDAGVAAYLWMVAPTFWYSGASGRPSAPQK